MAPLQLAHGLRDQFPPSKFLPALQRLAAAHDALGERPNWLQPKGVGVVCVAKNGMPKDSFVHVYFGKMYEQIFSSIALASGVSRDVPLSYPPSKWFEREAAIEVIKVTTSARACISQPANRLFRRAECPRSKGFAVTFTIWCSMYLRHCPGDTAPWASPPPPTPPQF